MFDAHGTVRLRASCLKSKFGFGDGSSIPDEDELMAAVQKHLLPLLDPRVDVYKIGSSHNPVRATEDTWQFIDDAVYVDIEVS